MIQSTTRVLVQHFSMIRAGTGQNTGESSYVCSYRSRLRRHHHGTLGRVPRLRNARLGDVHAAGAHVHAELVWRRLAPIAPHRRAWPKVRQRVSARRSQVDHASHPFQGRKGIAGCQHGDLRHKVSVHDFETDSWGHLGASAFSRASSEDHSIYSSHKAHAREKPLKNGPQVARPREAWSGLQTKSTLERVHGESGDSTVRSEYL